MARIDLVVPFSEKDEAKKLGARWDPQRKVWYLPDGVGPKGCERWLHEAVDITVRAPYYYIAQSDTHCWKCGHGTPVYGLVLPAGHETREWDDDDDTCRWYRHTTYTVLNYVADLAPEVAQRVRGISRHYFVDFSKTTASAYWMNHCVACGMKQGDFELFCEPCGAFCPVDAQAAARIVLHKVAAPFGACAGTSYGDLLVESMRRA